MNPELQTIFSIPPFGGELATRGPIVFGIIGLIAGALVGTYIAFLSNWHKKVTPWVMLPPSLLLGMIGAFIVPRAIYHSQVQNAKTALVELNKVLHKEARITKLTKTDLGYEVFTVPTETALGVVVETTPTKFGLSPEVLVEVQEKVFKNQETNTSNIEAN